MKALIFARVSNKDQEDGQSIPAQVRRLTDYAIKKNFTIDRTFQVTESSSQDTRKQFEQIISYVKKSKDTFALITDTVDRLQRSFRETPLLDELRKQGKIELHFLREGLVVNQSANSAQLLQWDIGVLFASSYVRQLSDNVKRSQEQCIRNGQWISKAPYGYTNITLPTGQKSIEVDPLQAACVVKIFDLYSRGNNSFQTVALKMRTEGFATTARGKSITARTVELILKNPFYMGMMQIKGQLHPHKYPTIITASMFNLVQQTIANHNKAPVQFAGKPILLRGLIQCKRCGCSVSGDIKKQKYVYYSCHNSKRICAKKWVKEEALLETILSGFDSISLTDKQITDIMAYIEENEEQEAMLAQQSQLEITRQINRIKERISKLVDMHLDGTIDRGTYQAKLDEYKQEQQELQLKIMSYCENEEGLVTARTVLNLAKEAKSIFMSSKLDEKQQLLRFFFSNFSLDGGSLDLELRDPFKDFAKLQDQTIWRQTCGTLRTFRWSIFKEQLNIIVESSFVNVLQLQAKQAQRAL